MNGRDPPLLNTADPNAVFLRHICPVRPPIAFKPIILSTDTEFNLGGTNFRSLFLSCEVTFVT